MNLAPTDHERRDARGPQQRRRTQRRGPERELLRAMLAVEYGAGSSIRNLCADHDLSYGLTRTLLVEARVKFRRRGQPHGSASR